MGLLDLRNALMAGKHKPTAKDYVQDGLIAMWDGIENAGWGKHDANATVWKDLVGVSDWVLGSGMSFGDDYITGDNSNNAYGALTQAQSSIFGTGANNVYVEFCITSDSISSGSRGIFAGPTTGDTNAITYISRMVLGNRQSITWNSSYSKFRGTFGVGLGTYVNGGPFGEGHPRFGTQNGYNAQQNFAMLFKYRPEVDGSSEVKLHNLRIWTALPPADVVAANYAIDKARFHLP